MKSFSLVPYKGNNIALINRSCDYSSVIQISITKVNNTQEGYCNLMLDLDLNLCTTTTEHQFVGKLFDYYNNHLTARVYNYAVEFPLWMRNRSENFYRKIFMFNTNC